MNQSVAVCSIEKLEGWQLGNKWHQPFFEGWFHSLLFDRYEVKKFVRKVLGMDNMTRHSISKSFYLFGIVISMIHAYPLFAEMKGDIELLRLIADGYEANLEKLSTWKGKVNVKGFHTPIPSTDWGERRWESENDFLLDRDQEAIRWHGKTVKGTQILEGKESQLPQSVHSGMIKSKYDFRLTFPDNEKGRRNLLIVPSGKWPRNFESNVFDPVHILTKEIYPGLLEQLRGYYKLQSEGNLTFSNGSVTRQGDMVTIETDNERGGDVGRIITRFVFDLSKGCCLTDFLNSSRPSESHWKLDYEEISGVYVMKKVALTYKDKREGREYISTREAILTNEMVNEPVNPAEFELDKIGMKPGDGVFDRVMGGISYDWKKEFTPNEALQDAGETSPVSINTVQEANTPDNQQQVDSAKETEMSDEIVDETGALLSTIHLSIKWIVGSVGILLIAGLMLYMRKKNYLIREGKEHE